MKNNNKLARNTIRARKAQKKRANEQDKPKKGKRWFSRLFALIGCLLLVSALALPCFADVSENEAAVYAVDYTDSELIQAFIDAYKLTEYDPLRSVITNRDYNLSAQPYLYQLTLMGVGTFLNTPDFVTNNEDISYDASAVVYNSTLGSYAVCNQGYWVTSYTTVDRNRFVYIDFMEEYEDGIRRAFRIRIKIDLDTYEVTEVYLQSEFYANINGGPDDIVIGTAMNISNTDVMLYAIRNGYLFVDKGLSTTWTSFEAAYSAGFDKGYDEGLDVPASELAPDTSSLEYWEKVYQSFIKEYNADVPMVHDIDYHLGTRDIFDMDFLSFGTIERGSNLFPLYVDNDTWLYFGDDFINTSAVVSLYYNDRPVVSDIYNAVDCHVMFNFGLDAESQTVRAYVGVFRADVTGQSPLLAINYSGIVDYVSTDGYRVSLFPTEIIVNGTTVGSSFDKIDIGLAMRSTTLNKSGTPIYYSLLNSVLYSNVENHFISPNQFADGYYLGGYEYYDNGYQKGKTDGYNSGFDVGYDQGFDTGYDQGLSNSDTDEAFQKGYDKAVREIKSGDFGRNFLAGVFTVPLDALEEFTLVQWETEDGRTISINLITILSAIVGLCLFVWFLKMFAGG